MFVESPTDFPKRVRGLGLGVWSSPENWLVVDDREIFLDPPQAVGARMVARPFSHGKLQLEVLLGELEVTCAHA